MRPRAKTERNIQIYKEKLGLNGEAALTYDQLAVKYNLHSKRIYDIVRWVKKQISLKAIDL